MGDVIVKPIFGSMGHGMVRVTDPESRLRVVRAARADAIGVLRAARRSIMAAATCACSSSAGVWSAPSSARRRLATGGRTCRAAASARAIELPADWNDQALRAAAAVGADYAGVDLLPSRDGEVFVLEVNGIPGWKGLQQATGVDVAGAIVEHWSSESRGAARRRADPAEAAA